MFNWILRYVIGGVTGKREIALLILGLWIWFTIYLLWREAMALEYELGLTVWKIYTPFCFATLAGAFGLEHWKTLEDEENRDDRQRSV